MEPPATLTCDLSMFTCTTGKHLPSSRRTTGPFPGAFIQFRQFRRFSHQQKIEVSLTSYHNRAMETALIDLAAEMQEAHARRDRLGLS
jgi:hypothetical protein